MSNYLLTEKRFKAIATNDKKANGLFFYAVKSTKIFCQPSCSSRLPKKENIIIYITQEEAISNGYRPCKRCKPMGSIVPDEEWCIQIKEYILLHYNQHITLDTIADNCHGSPYHLHRVFKKNTGLTPLDYLTQVRLDHAKQLLISTNLACSNIGKKIGFSNAAYFSTLFKKKFKQTPNSFRKQSKLLGN